MAADEAAACPVTQGRDLNCNYLQIYYLQSSNNTRGRDRSILRQTVPRQRVVAMHEVATHRYCDTNNSKESRCDARNSDRILL